MRKMVQPHDMQVELPDAALEGTGMTPELAKLEVAVALYRDRKVSMGRAARLAGLPRPQFQHELGKRGVTVDYDVEDLHADLKTLKSLGFP
jgi:predicted HTH domain antitoxin